MPVRLRLARHGTRNNPFYHIVAIADHKPRDARPIEKLGEYDPVPRVPKFRPPPFNADAPVLSSGLPQPPSGTTSASSSTDQPAREKRLEWNTERIRYWLQVGAQPSKPVAKMLDRAGLIPEGKWFKGMYRPPVEGTHFSPTFEQPPPPPSQSRKTPSEQSKHAPNVRSDEASIESAEPAEPAADVAGTPQSQTPQ
ncbi:unnamed protein product [Parajaminaea phylloscopi]